MNIRFVLANPAEEMCNAWERHFQRDHAMISKGSIFDQKASIIVTAGNSFGFMDGGLDKFVVDYFGPGIERAVQRAICINFRGECQVGNSVIVPTGDAKTPYLIYTPTMRFPSNVAFSNNAYLATIGALKSVIGNFAALDGICAMPAFCAGTGGMNQEQVARQMLWGFEASK